jgi:hypothetical protein
VQYKNDYLLDLGCVLAYKECMNHSEIENTLVFILEELKRQANYSHRLHGWVIAVAETIEQNAALLPLLKQHPLYDQGSDPSLPKTDALIQNIDAMIRRLKAGS